MAFMDRFKNSANSATRTASAVANKAIGKSKTAASIARVKMAITTEEDNLKKAYTELGRLFYRDFEAQADADMVEYTPWCEKATDARANILRLTEELTALKAELRPEKEAVAKEEAPAEVQEVLEEIEDTVRAAEEPAAAEEAAPEEEIEDSSIFAD